MDFAPLIQTVAMYAIPVLFSITLHEAAHAYAAARLGDDTAKAAGRMTINPLQHIDPIGTVVLPLMLYVVTGGEFLFGYAKPVPVRFDRLRHPEQDMVWVALAGPMANLLQALCWSCLFFLLRGWGVEESFWTGMARGGVLVNVAMFAFNLFPLPPLDGGRVLAGVLPRPWAQGLARIEPWGFVIVLALVLTEFMSRYWMLPLMRWTMHALTSSTSWLFVLVH
ncbi:site-2 protease family protein [Candidatus Symbiobacter mobilis]|uniref:Zn-dependent protease n=1 Tax=Candidatus Symbiobacter mobilis CR TaxID=946483 RepID=U5NAX5_9BURK|nr:site-2 protease family protein [Candidatus Symbiobacter mobilis]AGX88455.1 Zn-dependent protease [Candidatus Symbiobacter mobilis CR]